MCSKERKTIIGFAPTTIKTVLLDQIQRDPADSKAGVSLVRIAAWHAAKHRVGETRTFRVAEFQDAWATIRTMMTWKRFKLVNCAAPIRRR